MEVCPHQAVDIIFWGGLHSTSSIQHPANSEVIREYSQEDAWEGEESIW